MEDPPSGVPKFPFSVTEMGPAKSRAATEQKSSKRSYRGTDALVPLDFRPNDNKDLNIFCTVGCSYLLPTLITGALLDVVPTVITTG